ncbi:hypothetical protein N288_00015 [Bacillus infantis NRRL B-14911]|uniref:Uncharacterized protein n=1 Tax=Bacillus infantis NRRL B-14911 TaxID=1367477 RepID=U5L5K2_9BACI|nr:hypothetical protein N288_00015 [Bacillus infantis NRRL B-14911]
MRFGYPSFDPLFHFPAKLLKGGAEIILKRDPGHIVPENSEGKNFSLADSFPILYFTKKLHHLQRKEEIFMCQLLVSDSPLKQKNRRQAVFSQ